MLFPLKMVWKKVFYCHSISTFIHHTLLRRYTIFTYVYNAVEPVIFWSAFRISVALAHNTLTESKKAVTEIHAEKKTKFVIMSLHQNAEANYRKKSDYKAFKIVAMCNGFEKASYK
jgi:hypothetical protein